MQTVHFHSNVNSQLYQHQDNIMCLKHVSLLKYPANDHQSIQNVESHIVIIGKHFYLCNPYGQNCTLFFLSMYLGFKFVLYHRQCAYRKYSATLIDKSAQSQQKPPTKISTNNCTLLFLFYLFGLLGCWIIVYAYIRDNLFVWSTIVLTVYWLLNKRWR